MNLYIRTGGGEDTVNIQSSNAATTINTGGGDDTIRVNYNNLGIQTFDNKAWGTSLRCTGSKAPTPI